MISFQPTDEETEFVNVATKVAKDKIRPIAHECEDKKQVPSSLSNEIAELGFLSLEAPESGGGLEFPLITQVQIMTALSYGDLGIIQGLPGVNDAASFLRTKSHPFLENMLNNEKTVAFLDLTADDQPWGNQLQLNTQRDGYVVNGVSQPVRLARFADSILVAGVDAEGTSVVFYLDEQDIWQFEAGDIRLGLLASGIGCFSFNQTEVTVDKILAKGEEAEEWIQAARTRIYILQAAKQVGSMQAALDYATEYTAERVAFGQRIATFQGVSFRIANMAIETRIANHLVWEAAVKADEEEKDASGLALSALHRAHQSARYVTDSAVQLLGGHGYIQEYPAEKWARDALAQVTLYGREKDLLLQRGEQILAGDKVGVTV